MDKAIYVIIRSTGEYSDRYETVLGYFDSEEKAQEFCLAAEREWKEAAALFPFPKSPSITVWGDDEFETIYPERPIQTLRGDWGTVTITTPDYSAGRKVPRSDADKAHRQKIRTDYQKAHAAAWEARRNHIKLDRDGSDEATWYYEAAHPLTNA